MVETDRLTQYSSDHQYDQSQRLKGTSGQSDRDNRAAIIQKVDGENKEACGHMGYRSNR